VKLREGWVFVSSLTKASSANTETGAGGRCPKRLEERMHALIPLDIKWHKILHIRFCVRTCKVHMAYRMKEMPGVMHGATIPTCVDAPVLNVSPVIAETWHLLSDV
jgi:hypothetical protein